MTPIALVAVTATVALAAGLLGSDALARRAWQAGAAWLMGIVALGVWVIAEPQGEVGGPVYAVARDAAGVPVSVVAEVQREGARRQMRRVPLRSAVPGSEAALAALLALGVAGGVMVLVGRARTGAVAAGVGGVGALAVFGSAGGHGAGEAGVRAFLEGFDLGYVKAFSVPAEAWTYDVPGLPALGVAAVAGLLVAVSAWRPAPARASGSAVAGGAALVAALAVVWQLIAVGGLPWRPVEGALWGAAVLLAGAFFQRDEPLHAGTATGLAAALAALAWSLG
ncbi:MAG: hypothetical protein H6704_22225 [Myxococcales bacterium]|nr:hypothetical protein [Myxococcales bacterium]